MRDRWLNPLEWVEWIDEPVPGYPNRPVPRDDGASKALKKRTLTNLYNTPVHSGSPTCTTPLTPEWLLRTVGRSPRTPGGGHG